jgi:uncharacterized membrane protein
MREPFQPVEFGRAVCVRSSALSTSRNLGKLPQSFDLNHEGATMSEETPQSGLSNNAAGALAYVTIIPAIVFLLVEPYNKSSYVRFHSWQSIFLGIAAFALSFINIIPILGQIIFLLGMLLLFVLWIIVLLKALKGERYKLPFIGNLAEKQAGA